MNGHEFGVLLKAGLKRHKSGLLGIFVLIFLVSLSLGTVLTVWQNAQRHVTKELERVGYGQVTAWASGMDDSQVLADQIAALEEVSFVESQQVIFTNYEVDGQESDS
ncbi:MAG: ABC transporter permease, partial [Oscillospiraceae bacterium]|nr:ABC transporter permease [Oscillospiraceae bacterium]